MKTVLVRADGGHDIGLGHLMRCLSIAKALKSRGADVAFVTRTSQPELIAKLEAEGCSVLPLPSIATEDEAALELVKQAAKLGAKYAILDSYRITASHQRTIRAAGLRTLALCDLDSHPADADLVLNSSVLDGEADAKRLLGPRFAPLRPEFAAAKPRPGSKTIGLLFGGSDPHGLTAAAAKALEGLDVAALVGAAFKGELPKGLRVVQDPPNVADVMSGWGLAVAASGSSCWELACLGVPMVLMASSEDQKPIAAGLDARGIAVSLGASKPFPGEALRKTVESLLADGSRLKTMSAAGRALVDGLGAGRVADALLA